MKSNTLAVTLILGISLPWGALAAPPQDLQRINDIVNQARELADNVRQPGTPDSNQASPARAFRNPFAQPAASPANSESSLRTNESRPGVPNGSSAPAATTLGASQSADAKVAVDDQEIRIDAGGRQFVVPRIGTPHSASRTPNSHDTVDRAMSLANDYRSFAKAIHAFRNADYAQAKMLLAQAKTTEPQPLYDPFESLCLFAAGDFNGSAAAAYSAAARSQIWSWENLQSYYGNLDLYRQHYRQLQNAAQATGADASVHFLLGYHHLMLGHRDHATREFEQVLGQLPKDPVVSHLLNVAQQNPPLPGQ